MNSVFPQSGWEFVYDVRAAVRDGDVDRLRALAERVDDTTARQLGIMAPTLLGTYTGVNPSEETVLLAARVLHRHLARYDPTLAMTVPDFVEIIGPMMHRAPIPKWVDAPAFVASLVGFLMPDGDAEIRLRQDLEPLWARALEVS